MGKIVSYVTLINPAVGGATIQFDALVDTGSTYLTLPTAWRSRLGDLETLERVQVQTAIQQTAEGDVCGPVAIQLEGFRRVFGEVLFVDMEPEEGPYEPLIGYLVLEAIPVAVDMTGHRLVKVRALLK